MNSVKLVRLLALVCCMVIWISGCDQQTESSASPTTHASTSTSTKTLIRAGDFHQFILDPHQANDLQNTALLYDLYEGLVGYDIHGNIIPATAQSWESKDYLVWTFHLRSDAKWSDGSTVTAEDFVRSWQNLLAQKTPLAKYLGFIAIKNAKAILTEQLAPSALGVAAIDTHTLQIQLDKANAYLPLMLAHIALVPTKTDLYNGAYQLAEINEQKLRLTANPYYWHKTRTSFQTVEYWRNNLVSPMIDLQLAVKKQEQTTQFVPKLCTYYYELNPHHGSLRNIAVRQALISLISSKSALNNVPISGKASASLLPKSMLFGAYLDLPPAEQLLMQTQIHIQNPLRIHLTYDDSGINTAIAQNLARQFTQSDLIRVTLQPQTSQQWATQHTHQQFQLIRSGWCADYNDPSAFLNIFHSKSPDNLLQYHNQKVDQWLEQAMVEITSEKRQQLYQQVIDTLAQEAIVLPLFQYYLPIQIAPNLGGYDLNNPTQVFYSKDLYRLNHDPK